MKQLSNPLDPNSLLNKEIGETMKSKQTLKKKMTIKEILILNKKYSQSKNNLVLLTNKEHQFIHSL